MYEVLNGSKYPRNRAIIAGFIVFLLCFLVFSQIMAEHERHNVINAMAISILPGLAAALAVGWHSQKQKERRVINEADRAKLAYEFEVDGLYKLIRRNVATITEAIPEIKDEELRYVLQEICCHIPVILEKINEHKPDERLGSAGPISRPLEYIVVKVLPQYLEMQDPEKAKYFPDREELFVKTLVSLSHLEEYYRGTVTTLEHEDLTAFEVALTLIDPFEHSFPV